MISICRRHTKRTWLQSAVALVTVAVIPSGAQAQLVTADATQADQNTTQLGDIVVTARKRSEPLQLVPGAVTALDAGQLANAHATRLDDLSSLVSNLNIVTRADNSPDVTIRGVGSFGAVPGVGFYVNDIQQFAGQTVRPEDVEQIEVLKGPQGTLYGGNNIGGAIKYISKRPTDKFAAEFSGELGSFNESLVTGVLSGPLAPDFNGRISAYYSRDDGFIYNPTLDQTLGGESEIGGRITLEYASGGTTATFYFNGDHLRSRYQNLYYAPPDDRTYSLQTTGNVLPYYHRDLYSPSLVVKHAFGSVELTSITSYVRATTDGRTDGDHRAVPIFDTFQNLDTNVFSQELRLASTGSGRFKWLIGLYGQNVDSYFDEANNVNLTFLSGDPADTFTQFSRTDHTQEQISAFGDATFTLGAFDLEGGVRVQRFVNKLHDLLNPATFEQRGTVVLPKVSLDYRVTGQILAYTSVAFGFEPADNIDDHGAVSSYRSEYTTNYELGLKTTFLHHRARLNGALFYTDYKNRLFNTIDGATLQGITENIGGSYNHGFELDAMLKATRTLSFNAGLGIVKAKWRHIIVFDPTVSQTIDLNGRTAPFTPEYQANVGADWHHDLGRDYGFDAHVDAAFFGTQYWDITDNYRQRPYELLNARIGLTRGRYALSVSVKNILDQRYNTIFAAAEEIGAPFNTASIARPREVFGSFSVKY